MRRELQYKTSHVFPFLWVHGEKHCDIEKEILAIRECGISEFCVESRPHPDFCGEKWWADFDFILDVAKQNGMRVWLLDDKHFPTGYANGAVEKDGTLAPLCLNASFIDFYADTEFGRFIVNDNDDPIYAVLLFERKGDEIDYVNGKDVTSSVKDNVLSLRMEKHRYFRIVTVTKTRRFLEKEMRIDMLNPKATDMQIKNVYEPHYERYKEEFGKTFAGFFSDEPRFFNGQSVGYFNKATRYQIKPGLKGVVYPFSDEVENLLDLKKKKKKIIGLWEEIDDFAQFRIDYMNVITDIYMRNFTEKIGRWCAERGVLYVGHVVEDMGAHCRLGIGAGHYFKALKGQDMSGVDLVLHQVERAFFDKNHFYACKTLTNDSVFFYFTLAKLAVSAAHLDERKQNRALCEIFGAYGWGETLAQMKYFIDFMLVRGINYFVPHAFNPKLNDDDCPPYFYYGGKNPAFSGFKELMRYAERMCAILSVPYEVPVAVLYEAEADWAGINRRSMDEINKELFENQIDFEIVPSYDLKKTQAKVLIVPYAETYGKVAEENIAGFDGLLIRQKKSGNIIDEVLQNLKREYKLALPNKDIRILKRGNKFFVLNEGIDDCENAICLLNGKQLEFFLKAGEATLLQEEVSVCRKFETVAELPLDCAVYVCESEENSFSRLLSVNDYTADVNALVGYENFTGKIGYALHFTANIPNGKRIYLDFGVLSGGVKVKINGCEKLELFGIPYRIDVSDCFNPNGENDIWIELSTTLALKFKDKYTKYCKIEKGGFNDKIKILIS